MSTMSAIPAALVSELRAETGAPLMECKRALEAAGGDREQAKRLLREQGLLGAQKRADRSTSEGRVEVLVSDSSGAMVAVGSESEPVAKSEEFRHFVEEALAEVSHHGLEAVDALEERRQALAARLRENITVQAAKMDALAGEHIAGYVHPPARRLGVLVRLRGGSEELGRYLAMQIAAANPRYTTRDEVPAGEVDYERAVFQASEALKGKPEGVREQIVEGMLEKRFFGEQVLMEQDWVHDPAQKVKEALAEEGAECVEFRRLALS